MSRLKDYGFSERDVLFLSEVFGEVLSHLM